MPCRGSVSDMPSGRAWSRFLRAALDPIDIILCFELMSERSIGTAPSSHSILWSWEHLADRFHSVPQALLTTVRLGERSCPRSVLSVLCSLNTCLARRETITL